MATGSGDSSDDITPKKDHDRSTNSSGGRAQRREMLRNIPNACCAYVCPESPPLIHRSMGYSAGSSCSPRQKGLSGLQQLDSALAGISISDKSSDGYTSRGYKANTPGKRRSYSSRLTFTCVALNLPIYMNLCGVYFRLQFSFYLPKSV
ncbi:hypothetical protein PHET_12375 [Paragonimus heterotremus]|uniref:Uncharacterized protein n=1 Tax=Paragonimus heterotremus TaxID=100268 RepID=A0A8J4WS39_9TREM|nr:hypothetical protein PHET_12375 [Paragonimus heterotremus]